MTLWAAIAWALLTAAGATVAWAVLSDPARGRLRCPGGWRRALLVVPWRQGCWYDMGGVAGEGPHRCPECGRSHAAASLRRRRVRWRVVVLGVAVGVLAYPASIWPRMQRHGVWAGVPTWALVAAAPVEDYCRGALGCPFSWAAMPGATRELLMPTWDRPYASWEVAWLKRRLDATVERVRPEFPGRDAAFVPIGPLVREEVWGWEGQPLTTPDRAMLAAMLSETAMLFAGEGRPERLNVGVTAGLAFVLADPVTCGGWETGMEAIASLEGHRGELIELVRRDDLVIVAMPVARTVTTAAEAMGPASVGRASGQSPGGLWQDPAAFSASFRLGRVLAELQQRGGDFTPRSGLAPGHLVASVEPQHVELAGAMTRAVLESWDRPGTVGDPVTLGVGTVEVRCYNIEPLVLAAGAGHRAASARSNSILLDLIASQLRPPHGGNPGGVSDGSAGPNVLVIGGTPEEHARSMAEFERMMRELEAGPGRDARHLQRDP